MRTATVLRENYDLDSLSAPGLYACVAPANAPASTNYLIEVFEARLDGNACQFQVAYPEAGGAGSIRAFSGHDGWSAWTSLGGGGGAGGESAGGDTASIGADDIQGIALASQTNGFGTARIPFGLGEGLHFWAYPQTDASSGLHETTSITSTGQVAGGTLTNAGTRLASTPRVNYTAGGAANDAGGWVDNNSYLCHRGDGNPGHGGFILETTFGFDGTPTTPIFFCGLFDKSTLLNAAGTDTSDENNYFGIGCDEGDSNLYLMHKPAFGAAVTKVDLSTELGSDQLEDGAMYNLVIACLPGDAGFNIAVKRLDVADTSYVARVTTGIPAADQFLQPQMSISNGATAETINASFIAYHLHIPVLAVTA